VLLASRLPNMVLVLTGGVVADRRSRRGLMLASDAIRCLTQAATALLLVTGRARLWELLVLQAAHGAAAASRTASFIAQLADGWSEFRARPWLWASVLHVALLNLMVLAPLFVLGPVVAKHSLGGATGWATIATAYATGAVLSGLLGLRWRPQRPLLACSMAVLALAPLAAGLAVPVSLPLLAAAALLGGGQASLGELLWSTTLQQHLPAEMLSRVSAYGWLGALLFVPLGYAVAGPVAARIGVDATFWVGAWWVIVSTAGLLVVPGIRALRRRDAPETLCSAPAAG
jgi:MFS family permease